MAVGGIDFARTFGAGSQNNSGTQGAASQRPQAKYWLNIGYTAEGAGENGEDRFVSLPVGIPVDTTEKLAVKGKNESFVEFTTARNDLLDQIMAVADSLAPGEDRILNLQIQLRRVDEERAPVASEQNRFVRPLNLVSQPVSE